MVGTVNANCEYFELGVRDMAQAEAEYPGWLRRLLTHPVRRLDNYRERRPAATSSSNCRSQTAASNSANQTRNAFRSLGGSCRMVCLISFTLFIISWILPVVMQRNRLPEADRGCCLVKPLKASAAWVRLLPPPKIKTRSGNPSAFPAISA